MERLGDIFLFFSVSLRRVMNNATGRKQASIFKSVTFDASPYGKKLP